MKLLKIRTSSTHTWVYHHLTVMKKQELESFWESCYVLKSFMRKDFLKDPLLQEFISEKCDVNSQEGNKNVHSLWIFNIFKLSKSILSETLDRSVARHS